jgi:hypothetical protein
MWQVPVTEEALDFDKPLDDLPVDQPFKVPGTSSLLCLGLPEMRDILPCISAVCGYILGRFLSPVACLSGSMHYNAIMRSVKYRAHSPFSSALKLVIDAPC